MADRRAPRARRRPSGSDRFTPADPVVVEGGLAGGEQAAGEVPGGGAAGARESEAPVGDEVAADRRAARSRTRTASTRRGTSRTSETAGAGRPSPRSNRSKKPAACSSWLRGTEGGRADDHPAAGQRGEPHPRRVEGDHGRAPAAAAATSSSRGRRCCSSSSRSARARVHRQPVEVDPVLVAGRGGAGADPHRGQPEQPVDRRGGEVDGAHPVHRRREHVPVEQPAPQLDPAAGDPEAGGEVAQQAEGDREWPTPSSCHGSPPAAVPATTMHDQHRQEPDQLADRVDQQHPRVEPLPLGVPGEPVTGVTWRRPRRRPPSRSARRRAARATSLSRPTIASAPAADAVVTVTVASPNSRAMRALDVVDGLDPRHRRDPALPRPPAGLRVDRRVGDLPAVHG